MNGFLLHRNGDVDKIVVHSIKKETIDSLVQSLMEAREYEISFFNIKMIPLALLLALEKTKTKNIRIETNEKRLATYLRQMGFDSLRYLEKKNPFSSYNRSFPKAIAIGGSAGSLEKITKLLQTLPEAETSIFVIAHQKKESQNLIAPILRRHTKHYDVQTAHDAQKILPGTIYVAPVDKQMEIHGEYIFLNDKEERNFAKPSISVTFESLAKEYEEEFVAILLCGYGQDGSDALETVKELGGTVIVQQPFECMATPMLTHAIETKRFDYIFPLEDIAAYLQERLWHPSLTKEELEEFLEKINDVYGYDFRNYDVKHIRRRIELFYKKYEFGSFTALQYRVLQNRAFFEMMFLEFSINVSTFFRQPAAFAKLKEILAKSLKEKGVIKIWSAGCSTAEEPYSLAILLEEMGLLDRCIIYATDMNDTALQQAKNAAYPKERFEDFYINYKAAGGKRSFASYFDIYEDFIVVKKRFREKVLFFKHNLVADGVLNEFQLIFCRNVIIYFDTELTNRVLRLFHDSLETGGILVLGESETNRETDFVALDEKNRIFQKVVKDGNNRQNIDSR